MVNCFNRRGDSLGGAAPDQPGGRPGDELGFNRRGDSLGGAAQTSPLHPCHHSRFNRRGDSLGGAALARRVQTTGTFVSIAGAILWGVLRKITPFFRMVMVLFQSQGRFFGGCCVATLSAQRVELLFQSQGRFFGGCCGNGTKALWLATEVSIAGAILWGVLRPLHKCTAGA